MHNLKLVSSEDFLPSIMLNIYDSSNHLFNDERWKGDKSIFDDILKDSQVLLALVECSSVGFISFRSLNSKTSLITGLYVKKEYQMRGIASELLHGSMAHLNQIVFVKVLRNASWAINFYIKHEFAIATTMENFCLSDELKFSLQHNNRSDLYVRVR